MSAAMERLADVGEGRPIRLVYFAWVRERVGRAEETVAVPAGVASVADLVAWLKARGPGYAAAFAEPGLIRAAVDQVHVKPGAAITNAREIAFFPPVTGG